MATSRPSTDLTRPVPDAPAAASGASWTTLTSASADNTLAGQGSTTFSDEASSELRLTIDTTTSQVMNNLNNHGGMKVWDTGLTVADMPTVTLRLKSITTPTTAGSDVYFIAGVIVASSTTPTPSSDKSCWTALLWAPVNEVGTTVHQMYAINNANPSQDSNLTGYQQSRVTVQIMEDTMGGKGFLVRNSGGTLNQDNSNTSITGLTSSDKVLIFVAGGHRQVDTPTAETVGMRVDYLAVAEPT